MTRWLRLLALASVLSIGESCGLKPPAMPNLEIRGALAPAAQEVQADREQAGVESSRAIESASAAVRSVRLPRG